MLAYERDANGHVRALQAESSSAFWTGAIVVLIDARTASMAELFAGALQDRGRALLIGERSYGKGVGQTLVLLSSPIGGALGAVEVTERAFYRLDGAALHGLGVTPFPRGARRVSSHLTPARSSAWMQSSSIAHAPRATARARPSSTASSPRPPRTPPRSRVNSASWRLAPL